MCAHRVLTNSHPKIDVRVGKLPLLESEVDPTALALRLISRVTLLVCSAAVPWFVESMIMKMSSLHLAYNRIPWACLHSLLGTPFSMPIKHTASAISPATLSPMPAPDFTW